MKKRICTKCGVKKAAEHFSVRRPNCKKCGVKEAERHREKTKTMWKFGQLHRPPQKFCPKCRNTKDAKHFGRVTTNRSGLAPYCLICVRHMHKEYRRTHVADHLIRTARKRAYEDAVRQIWPLMGFALRDKLAAA